MIDTIINNLPHSLTIDECSYIHDALVKDDALNSARIKMLDVCIKNDIDVNYTIKRININNKIVNIKMDLSVTIQGISDSNIKGKYTNEEPDTVGV